MRYRATSKNIRGTDLSHDFIGDIMYCETNHIPLKAKPLEFVSINDLIVSRYDGQDLPSGKDYWIHDNREYNVLEPWDEVKLPEELFTL